MDTVAAAGFLTVGAMTTMFFIAVAIWILYIVAYWRVFTKAGEPGWKSIIPIYNQYVLYKISWTPTMFWVLLAGSILGGILLSQGGAYDAAGEYYVTNMMVAGLGTLCMLVVLVVEIMQLYWLCRSYGHGIGYFFGLIFLNWIFMLVLGFGSSNYMGPKGQGAREYQ